MPSRCHLQSACLLILLRPEEEFTEEEFKKLKRKIDWVIL